MGNSPSFQNTKSPSPNQTEAQRSGFGLERKSDEAQTKKQPPLKETVVLEQSEICSDVVEPRGVEPLSESTLKETSPGAVGCFRRSYRLFPSLQAKRQACSSGSFIMRGELKALRTHGRLSSTPHFRVEAFPEGTGHGLSRGQSNFVVVL